MGDPVSVGIQVALMAAQAALQASRKIEGPRLKDLHVTTAGYGGSYNYSFGTRRFDGIQAVWALPIEEVSHRRKTKGGKFNDYTYFGTAAYVIVDHPSQAVRRIWLDRHLAYDASGAGPISPFSVGSGDSIINYLRIYLGEETAEPDPAMEAAIDAELGEGSTPAMRNQTGLVLDRLPLQLLGNHLPQVTAEVVTNATPSYPTDTEEQSLGGAQGFTFSSDFSRFTYLWGTTYTTVDNVGRAVMTSGTLDPGALPVGADAAIGIGLDGKLYVHGGGGGGAVLVYPAEGSGPGSVYYDTGVPLNFVQVKPYGALGLEKIVAAPFAGHYIIAAGVAQTTLSLTGFDWQPIHYLTDTLGDVWCVGTGSDGSVFFYCITAENGQEGRLVHTAVPVGAVSYATVTAFVNSDNNFALDYSNARYLEVDYASGAILHNVAGGHHPANLSEQLLNTRAGASFFWVGSGTNSYKYDASSFDLLQTADLGLWGPALFLAIYDPINNALVGINNLGQIQWNFLDRVDGEGVLLSTIVDVISARCGIPAGDLSTTALDQVVEGFSYAQGAGRPIFEHLLDVYGSEVRAHNFAIEYIKRGGAIVGSVGVSDLGAGPNEETRQPRYVLTPGADTDLPYRLDFNFADPAIDQQANSVAASRSSAAVFSQRATSIDATTLVIDAEEARNRAEAFLRYLWFSAETGETSVSRKYTRFECGDVWQFQLDDLARGLSITSITRGADGVLDIELERARPAIHTLPSLPGIPALGFIDAPSVVAGYVKGLVIDTPLITDGDEGLVSYVLAGPFTPGAVYSGATFYESSDGIDYTTIFENVPSNQRMTWGVVTGAALPDRGPEVWDYGSSLDVEMKSGTLVSASKAEVAAGANWFAIGSPENGYEIVGVRSCVLMGTNTYRLSGGMLRGRRGSEWATAGHAAGDTVVLLDAARVRKIMAADDLGALIYYRATSPLSLPTAGFPQSLTYTGASLKPYAVGHLRGVRDPITGDIVWTWVRRTRIGGQWRDFEDASLGETTEAYQARILNAAGATLRTYSSLTSPTFTHTAAEQAEDADAVWVRVNQMSSVVGRGYPTTTAIATATGDALPAGPPPVESGVGGGGGGGGGGGSGGGSGGTGGGGLGAGAGGVPGVATIDLDAVSAIYIGGDLTLLSNTNPSGFSEANYDGSTTSFGPNEVRRTNTGIHVRSSDTLVFDPAGDASDMLEAAQGWISLEFQGLARTGNTISGDLLSLGSTHALTAAGHSALTSGSAESSSMLSGWRGICIAVLTWDGTDARITMDGGPMGIRTGTFTRTGAKEILKDVAGIVRRIRIGNYKLSDADAQTEATLMNRALVRPGVKKAAGSALSPAMFGATTIGFYDEFAFDSRKTRDSWNNPNSEETLNDNYKASFEADNRRVWLDRQFYYVTSRYGTGDQAINGEPQNNLDFNEPDNFQSSKVENSNLVIIYKRGATMTAPQQAALNADNNGTPFLYGSALFSTRSPNNAVYGGYEQAGGIFAARIKHGMFPGYWGAFWRYAYSNHAEDDINEHYGPFDDDFHTTVHSRGGTGIDFTFNNEQITALGFNLSYEHHVIVRVCDPAADEFHLYLDGEYLCTNPVDAELRDTPQYLVLNGAIYPPLLNTGLADPIIDAQDDRSKIYFDRVLALRFVP